MDHPAFGNDWMVWNLVLASVPAFLAAWLFRGSAHRGLGWWLGVATFVAFLPNAPYVLTDVVHLPADLRATSGSFVGTAAVLGVYAAFAAAGFTAYAFSLSRLGAFLRERGVPRLYRGSIELGLHCLCAVGIVLGRVFRFNSWDLLSRPDQVLDSLRIPPSERAILIVAFLVVTLSVGTILLRGLWHALERNRSFSSGPLF